MHFKPVQLLYLIVAMTVSFSAYSVQDEQSLVIVTNKNIDVVSIEQLRVLFTLKQKYLSNDKRAILLIQPIDSQATLTFCQIVFGFYPYQLQRIWDIAVFSGRGKAPLLKDNENQLIEYIMNNENTIGYALASPVRIKELKESVNVISID